MKELLIGAIIGLIFGCLIVGCMDAEDKLIKEHCSGLTGYEYGACQASIY